MSDSDLRRSTHTFYGSKGIRLGNDAKTKIQMAIQQMDIENEVKLKDTQRQVSLKLEPKQNSSISLDNNT